MTAPPSDSTDKARRRQVGICTCPGKGSIVFSMICVMNSWHIQYPKTPVADSFDALPPAWQRTLQPAKRKTDDASASGCLAPPTAPLARHIHHGPLLLLPAHSVPLTLQKLSRLLKLPDAVLPPKRLYSSPPLHQPVLPSPFAIQTISNTQVPYRTYRSQSIIMSGPV